MSGIAHLLKKAKMTDKYETASKESELHLSEKKEQMTVSLTVGQNKSH